MEDSTLIYHQNIMSIIIPNRKKVPISIGMNQFVFCANGIQLFQALILRWQMLEMVYVMFKGKLNIINMPHNE